MNGDHAPWQVYLLRCADGSLYCGVARDAQQRLARHQSGSGAKYTKSHPPLHLAAVWQTQGRAAASRLEYRLKRLGKRQKEALVQGASLAQVGLESESDLYQSLPL